MVLLQISEPGQTPLPHQRRVAVGIDLGTTNSLVATVRSGQAQTLPDNDGEHLLPSVVHYGLDHNNNVLITVGTKAKNSATSDPKNTVSSVKRLMGRNIADIDSSYFPYTISASENGVPILNLPNKDVNPIQVSADILGALAQRAKESLGEVLDGVLDGVVITVPAYFDDTQRQATKDAANLAGLHVLRLLNEPTAAAIAYGLDTGQEGVIAVYDLGGGTFDVSILCLSKGVFEVLATGGDTALGGDDFDHLLAQWIADKLNIISHHNPYLQRQLLDLATKIKIALSDKTHVTFDFNGSQAEISRQEFDKLIDPLVKKTLLSCRRVLKDANVNQGEVVEVVMVGGSTRIPYVRDKVGKFFDRSPLTSIDPDRVVAIGASIQADILVGNKPDTDMLLLDVIPLSLGIETMGGLVEKIIPRNSTIPCAWAQEFTTFKEGQTAMMIHVLQGERETVNGCRSLARFTLHGIPPMSAGSAHIRVTFQVDADGLLSVSAMEKSTHVQTAIQIKPSYGLTDDEIARMIQDSLVYAVDDKYLRRLTEQKVEATRILESLQTALDHDADLLSQGELHTILKEKHALATLIADQDQKQNSHKIEKQIKILDSVTQDFATMRIDRSISKALTGHRFDDI